MTRIAILDDYQKVANHFIDPSRLPSGAEVVTLGHHIADAKDLIDTLAPFEVVVAMRERTPFPASVFEQLPRLKLFVTTGMANAVVDMEAAVACGVTVTGTRGIITPTSELAWGLILGVLRHISQEDSALRSGQWQTTLGGDLAGRTLGLLGLGRLGALVARVGQAFQMSTLAWSQNLTVERAEEVGVQLVGREELFTQADVLSIHLVLSDRTQGLVGYRELRSMKDTAILVNTSRGSIVDEAALVEALKHGWIAGAGIDVFNEEPLPQHHPLLDAPNTVLTPHIGYVTEELYRRFYLEIVENIVAWDAGAPVRVLAEP